MTKSGLFLAAVLLLPSQHAQSEAYRYFRQESGDAVVYYREPNRIIATLPEIRWNEDLKNADLSIPKGLRSDWIDSVDENDECYSYLTYGSYVVRAGKVLENIPDTPAVDAASFRAFGRFASDKDSLYFDGVRTDDNVGKKRVDMENLKAVADNSTMLTDGRSLYVKGRWWGSANGFTPLAQKPWRQRGTIDEQAQYWKWKSQCLQSPNGKFDVIARINAGVLINGELIDADSDSFKIIRWMPNELLVYRDRSGIKRHAFGKGKSVPVEQKPTDCSRHFELKVDSVTWRKQRATSRGNDCVVETIPGVDPEQFRLLTLRIAQYQDRLYAIERTKFGEDRLRVVNLDKPDLVIDRFINAGTRHGYLIRDANGSDDDRLLTFATSGPLVVLTAEGEFAHDDRYIYIFDSYGQLHRHETASPQSVRIEKGELSTAEGTYRPEDGAFFPNKEKSDKVIKQRK